MIYINNNAITYNLTISVYKFSHDDSSVEWIINCNPCNAHQFTYKVNKYNTMEAVYYIVCSAGVELTLQNLLDRI